MTNSLLSGVRVLDVSRLLPGPFCSLYLAQLGAEVIKVEEPGTGDYARDMPEMFNQVNRGKKSVVLDLRLDADRAKFHELVKTADVVLESFRPGVMDKLGCGYQTLRALNPRIVFAALTGYGQTGPYRDWAGHDMNYLSIAGVFDQMGAAGGPPTQANVQIADLAGGALTCAIGILAALLGARATGHGTFVDVAMMDGSLALMPIALAALRAGQAPERGADLLSGALPNYTVYRCRDGKYLSVGALEPKFFVKLLQELGTHAPAPLRAVFARVAPRRRERVAGEGADAPPRKAAPVKADRLEKLTKDPRKARRVLAPVRWALQAVFLMRTRDAWAELLSEADACVTPVLTPAEALDNVQVRARGMVEDDNGKPAFALPIRFDAPLAPAHAAPALGADTEEILGALSRPATPPRKRRSAG